MKGEVNTNKRSKKSGARHNKKNRENLLVSLAMDLAEEKLRNGTASSQIIAYFLNLGSEKMQLENEKLRSDLKVAEAKIEDIQSRQDIKELYQQAIESMNIYSGTVNRSKEEYYDEE